MASFVSEIADTKYTTESETGGLTDRVVEK